MEKTQKLVIGFILAVSVIVIYTTITGIINYDIIYIILGAFIAGGIGVIVHKINSNSEKRDILKNIRECLDYELETTIDILNKKTKTLEPFEKYRNNPNKKHDLNAETLHINDIFNSGYQDIKMPLLNAIYSNNYVFNLSQNELKNIKNIQIYLDDYNIHIRAFYVGIQQMISNEPVNNFDDICAFQITFFLQHKELNEDLVKKLENLKIEFKENN